MNFRPVSQIMLHFEADILLMSLYLSLHRSEKIMLSRLWKRFRLNARCAFVSVNLDYFIHIDLNLISQRASTL